MYHKVFRGDILAFQLLIFVGLGLWLFFGSFRKYKELRLIMDTPTSKIRSIAMGPVEVCGAVVPAEGEMVEAPFSGRKCAYCRWTVEVLRSKDSAHWEVINKGEVGKYFFVKDETGCVLVDPKGAKIDVPSSYTSRSLSERTKKFLDENEIRYKFWVFKKDLRFREYSFYNGNYAYVLGYAGDNPYIEDGTDAGQPDIMIQNKRGCFFFITDKPEGKLVEIYKAETFLGMFGGAALVVASLYFLFGAFGVL